MPGHWRTDPLTDEQRDLLGSEVALKTLEIISKKGVALANTVYRTEYDFDEAYDHALNSVILKVRHFNPSKGIPVGAFLAYFGAAYVKKRLLKSKLSHKKDVDGLDESWSALYDLKKRDSFADEEKIHTILKGLPKQMQTVIEMTYGLNGEPQSSVFKIAKHLKIRNERVRQILYEGLRYLKKLIPEEAV